MDFRRFSTQASFPRTHSGPSQDMRGLLSLPWAVTAAQTVPGRGAGTAQGLPVSCLLAAWALGVHVHQGCSREHTPSLGVVFHPHPKSQGDWVPVSGCQQSRGGRWAVGRPASYPHTPCAQHQQDLLAEAGQGAHTPAPRPPNPGHPPSRGQMPGALWVLNLRTPPCGPELGARGPCRNTCW